jgi:hypothetical protein
MNSIRTWYIYLCPQCNASDPPKDKFVVVVYKSNSNAYGFFINSEIPRFIQSNPDLLKSQLQITPQEYTFLRHISYIGCNDLKEFFDWELKSSKAAILPAHRIAIQQIVLASITLTKEQIRRIQES